jgi:hypothetical protein
MRSQQEILEKIEQIEKSKCDPTGMQRKALIHKLTWSNAQPFLTKKDPETEDYWRVHSCIEKIYLMKQMEEQSDYTYMLIADKDLSKIFVSMQILMILVWLLGPRKDKFLRIFVPEMMKIQNDFGRHAMKEFCEEFGLRHDLFCLRYLNETDSGLSLS